MNTTELSFASDLTVDDICDGTYDKSKYRLNFKKVKYDGQSYTIVQYDKKSLLPENIQALRNIRSLIFDDYGRLLCISPPKSLDVETFRKVCNGDKTIDNPSKFYQTDVYIEPLIEGTMINVFYDKRNGKWICATKGNIGATHSFFSMGKHGKTFREMFNECATNCGVDIESFHTEYCYSFVIQHVENRLVSQFDSNKLILIKAYHISRERNNNNSTSVKLLDTHGMAKPDRIDIDEIGLSQSELYGDVNIISNNKSHSSMCKLYTINMLQSVRELNEAVFGHPPNDHPNADYGQYYLNSSIHTKPNERGGLSWMSHIGINFVSKLTGDRMRVRSSTFQYIRMLRGNQPKLECHYLDLLKSGSVGMYLAHYPEHLVEFNTYQTKLDMFVRQLYTNYVECYIKKMNPLHEFPKEYRTHMFNIHSEYKRIKESGQYIRMKNVVDYVNSLESHIIMYSLNYNMRKHSPETKKNESVSESVDL
jgi:hypothetical protein